MRSRVLAVFLAACLLLSLPMPAVQAAEGSAGDPAASVPAEQLLRPGLDGVYTVSYDRAVRGERYVLFVAKGIYRSISSLTIAEISSKLLYIDQQTAAGETITFHPMFPSDGEASTVILSGESGEPVILGYMIGGNLQLAGYYEDSEGITELADSYTIPASMDRAEFLQSLPYDAYAKISSDAAGDSFLHVTFSWEGLPEQLNAGEIYRITGTPDADGATGSFAQILSVFVASVQVTGEEIRPVSLAITKEKVVYQVGEAWSADDLAVQVTYDDGSVKRVTGFTCDTSRIDTTKAGTCDYTVSYTESGETVTAEGKIYVVTDTAAVCTVKFDSRGGTYVYPQTVTKGETITLPDAPQKPGFTFVQWYQDRSLTEPFVSKTPIEEDMTLYAVWESLLQAVPVSLRVSLDQDIFFVGEKPDHSMMHVTVLYSDNSRKELTDYTENLSSINVTVTGTKILTVNAKVEGVALTGSCSFTTMTSTTDGICTVSFVTGTSDTIEPQQVPVYGFAREPGVSLTKARAVFGGWSYDGKKWDFAQPVKESMELEAIWLTAVESNDDSDIVAYVEDVQNPVYTGKQIKPSPVVMDKNLRVLRLNKDYTLRYENNTNASTGNSTAMIHVTAKGNYKGTLDIPFTIDQKALTDETAVTVALADAFAYKAKGVKPTVTVKYGKTKLVKDRDYTVSFEKLSSIDAVKGTSVSTPIKTAGYYLVRIKGKNNFAGERIRRFQYAAKNDIPISKAKITKSADYKKISYTGEEIDIAGYIALSAGKNKSLTQGTHYRIEYTGDHTAAGKVTYQIVAISGSGYYGIKKDSFNIAGLPLKNASITLNAASYPYTGGYVTDCLNEITYPANDANRELLARALSVEAATLTAKPVLSRGRDYALSYRNNTRAGTAKIQIIGKGAFTGTVTKSFQITKIPLGGGEIAVKYSPSVVYSKSGAVPAVMVTRTFDGMRMILTQGVDYQLSSRNNKKVGDGAQFTVKGMGNYTGSVTKSYTIKAKSLTSGDMKVVVANMQTQNKKTGFVYKPKVTIYDKGKAVAAADFSLDLTRCVKQENLSASGGSTRGSVIIGAGKSKNYVGSVEKIYYVTSQSIAGDSVVISPQVYTGGPIEFSFDRAADRAQITVQHREADGTTKTLRPGTDFSIVSYQKNTDVGKATVVLQGMGAYSGTKKAVFEIVSQSIAASN